MMIGDQTPQVRDEDGAFSRQNPAFELHRSIASDPPPLAGGGTAAGGGGGTHRSIVHGLAARGARG